MNPLIDRLEPYPFEKLAALLRGATPPADRNPIPLSIGEPRHPTPELIRTALIEHLGHLATYPNTRGLPALREAIADWLTRRFRLPAGAIDPARQVLPVSGTREALFAFAQAVLDPADRGLVLMPNPFYQIYEGAALLAGHQPWFLPCTGATGYRPDFDAVPDDVWRRCRLLYVCSPGNPTGAVLDLAQLTRLIDLAERFDFIIAADECYSDLYADEDQPPPGLLQAAAASGRVDFARCVVFHSLSKRSNAPGLRSGFVAGDGAILERFFAYRTYHGCAMPVQHQYASLAAWRDEAHVVENRALYRAKFQAVLAALDGALEVTCPPAGFYLWPRTPVSDPAFARGLFAATHVTVLPGSFLARPQPDGSNPGADRVRMALVAPMEDCVAAAGRIRDYVRAF